MAKFTIRTGSHFNAVAFSLDYAYQNIRTADTIACARIWRNLGYKAANGYAQRNGLDMRLVRLACQLEAIKRQAKQA